MRMQRTKTVLAAMLIGAALAPSAGAATFTLDDYSVQAYDRAKKGLRIDVADLLPSDYSFDLAVGQSVTVDLFRIWTREKRVLKNDKLLRNISADFDFSALGGSFGTEGLLQGSTAGARGGRYARGTHYGEVQWTGPQTLHFGEDGSGEFLVTLSGESFNQGRGKLKGRDRGAAVVQATFTYVRAPGSGGPSPEGGTLPRNGAPDPTAPADTGNGSVAGDDPGEDNGPTGGNGPVIGNGPLGGNGPIGNKGPVGGNLPDVGNGPDLGDLGGGGSEDGGGLQTVPEPGTMALLGSGLMGLAAAFRRRSKG